MLKSKGCFVLCTGITGIIFLKPCLDSEKLVKILPMIVVVLKFGNICNPDALFYIHGHLRSKLHF